MIELKRGDCLDGLRDWPDGSADVILTDPPYHTTALALDAGGNDYGAIWRECMRVLKPAGWFFSFGSLETLAGIIAAGWRVKFSYVWEKGTPVPVHGGARHPLMQHELIGAFIRPDLQKMRALHMDYEALRTWAPKARSRRRRRYGTSRFQVEQGYRLDRGLPGGPRPADPVPEDQRAGASILVFQNKSCMPLIERTEHPTQKPQALLQYLIRGYCPPDGLVVDPFAGSGSTLLAARAVGRSAAGWERDDEWYRLARGRVDGALERFVGEA